MHSVSMDNSVLSSDDTGFSSATDEQTEEECEISEGDLPQPRVLLSSHSLVVVMIELHYEKLLAKYLQLAKEPLRLRSEDPFHIVDYNEMVEVLKLTPDRSGLQVTGHLLELCVEILRRQVEVYGRDTSKIVDDIVRQKRCRKRRLEEADNRRNPCQSRVGDPALALFLPDAEIVTRAPLDEEICFAEYPTIHTAKRSCRLKANNQGKFIANESSIIFDESSACPDVITRRKLLHMKFQELASESFYCDINNLHDQYGSETAAEAVVGTTEIDADAKEFFRLFGNRRSSGSEQMAKLLPFFVDTFPNRNEGESEDCSEHACVADSQNEERSPANDENLESENIEPSPIDDRMPCLQPQNGLSLENDENLESENIQPSPIGDLMPCLQAQDNITEYSILSSMDDSMPFLEEQENISENIPNQLSGLPKTDKAEKKSSKKERSPLEPLNISEMNLIIKNFGIEPEAKRARELSEIASLDQSSLLLDRQLTYTDVGVVPDFDCSSSYDLLQTNDNELTAQMSEKGLRIPSPLFDSSATNKTLLRRPSLVDVKAVIKKLENTVVTELANTTREEMPFLELIHKSDLTIIQDQEWERASSYQPNHSTTVSVAMAFLASLHMAHSQSLYLVPTDDELLKITKQRPHIQMPQEVEHSVKIMKGIKRIRHQRED